MTPETALDADARLAIDLHRSMLKIRLVDEAIAARYAGSGMRCPVHLSVGQEAVGAGVCGALRVDDKVFSTHRSHAHYLAKGGDLRRMLAEIYGKADGCVGGRGGSMHLMDTGVGMEGSIPIVGSNVPLAVGQALADRQRGIDRVSVVFLGDAAVEEGVVHESLNLAVLLQLPVVFVCENNLYSVYTPLSVRQGSRPLVDIPRAHGLPAEEGDGNDVRAVHAMASTAVDRARAGGGPSFLVFETYRWREHCGPNYDNDIGYRSVEEFEAWRARDPLARHEAHLDSLGVDAGTLEDARRELEAEIDDAFRFAEDSPLPTPEQALAHVYPS